MTSFRIGLNPLPWVLTADGFNLTEEVLRGAFDDISQTPFRGIHADPPAGMDSQAYAELLAEFGLTPAPGYFSAQFADVDTKTIVAAAKQHAAFQAALGNTEVFMAESRAPIRRERPAVGAEGVRPAFHAHVGTWIETEDEVEALLQGVPASILGFGPDTGHLAWAGIRPDTVIARHSDRVAAVHLKDVRLDQAADARAAGADYTESTRGPHHVWTEPGRGDVDLTSALASLPDGYQGWVIVEVDVPEAPTNLESTQISARWIADHYGPDVF